jgi:hypothetical protein
MRANKDSFPQRRKDAKKSIQANEALNSLAFFLCATSAFAREFSFCLDAGV